MKTKTSEKFNIAGRFTVEIYSKNGRLHRDDGPAWSLASDDGPIIEMFFRNGQLDRTSGPAMSVEDGDGSGFELHFRSGVRVGPE